MFMGSSMRREWTEGKCFADSQISVGTVVELQEGSCGVEKPPEGSFLGNGRETRTLQTSF